VKQPYHREGKSYYSNDSREDKRGGRLSLRVAHAPNDNGKLVDTEGRNSPILAKKSPGAAAFALKRVFCAPDGFAEAARFDFPPIRRKFLLTTQSLLLYNIPVK
jgi:hypothetical protein